MSRYRLRPRGASRARAENSSVLVSCGFLRELANPALGKRQDLPPSSVTPQWPITKIYRTGLGVIAERAPSSRVLIQQYLPRSQPH